MNRRQTKWALLAALTVLLCVGGVSVASSGPGAKKLYSRGQAAEAKDDPISAYENYYQAWQKEPKNLRYKTAYERLRFQAAASHITRGEKLLATGDTTGALTEFLRALEIDPSNELAHQDIQKARDKLATATPSQETSIPDKKAEELSEVGSPVQLKPISDEPLTLHMTEDTKVIYTTVGKAAGINVLFDPEYTSKRVSVDIANVSLLDALRIVGTVSGTFWHPITPNTIFVAMNTRAKRQELEEEAVQTFYLANTAQQNDLNDIQTALRNLLVNAKLYGVPSQSAIVMRATPDELLLAQKLINDLDKSRPEVVVDVALLEVNRDKTRTIGIQLPGTFGVALQNNSTSTTTGTTTTGTTTTGTTTTGTTSNNLTLNSLSHLNATNFAVTIGQATANLLLSDSDTKVLQNPSIRATDGQKADLKVGSRIPVATGSYQTGAATAVVSSLVNTQFTYLDVGVEIEITPIVHYDRDVTLKIKIVSSQEQGSTNIGGITEPIISQRTADQTVRLKEGEVNILGGFLQKQDLITVGGTPGLGELPIIKYLFSSTARQTNDDEIIFMLTPHVVRATDITPLNLQEIDTGTGTNVELRRIAATGPQAGGLPPGLQPHAAAPAPGVAAPGVAAPGVAAPTAAGSSAPGSAAASSIGAITMALVPPPIAPKAGSTFQVAVGLNGAQDVFSVPMQVHYDNTKLSLVNVDSGSFLGHDGQAIALVHRDDGVGNVVISASRPPGAPGVNGAGTVCVLTFQANAPGDVALQIIRASAKNSAQQAVNIAGSETVIHVQ